MDSTKDHDIIMEYKNKMIKFQEFCDGLYYCDTANKSKSHINS